MLNGVFWIASLTYGGVIPAGKNAQNTSAEKDHNIIGGFLTMFVCF